MGLSSEMKTLSEDILASFKQRIKENEELVDNVKETLKGFHKNHQEMANDLNAKATALRKNLSQGEKERLKSYNGLMSGIHHSIASIQKEVSEIQSSTISLINEFTSNRKQMAKDLSNFFAENKSNRMQNEKNRMEDFEALMKKINSDIKNIHEEVATILKDSNDLLNQFKKEHQEMSAELRAKLSKELSESVKYTRLLLKSFQHKLLEISKDNQKTAQKLRDDLANDNTERLDDYHALMKETHLAINEIRKEVKTIQKSTANMLSHLSKDRIQGSAEWNKMLDTIAKIRKTGAKEVKESHEKVTKKEAPVEETKKIHPEIAKTKPVVLEPKPEQEPKLAAPKTLEQKVLDYINKHPQGVKISEMEEPLNETRMKIGYIAKVLLDEGKVKKEENIYFPL